MNTLEQLSKKSEIEIDLLVANRLGLKDPHVNNGRVFATEYYQQIAFCPCTDPVRYMTIVTDNKINIEFDDNRDAMWCLVRNNSECESTNDFPVEEVGTAVCIAFLLSGEANQ